VFIGKRWENQIYSILKNVILSSDWAAAAADAAAIL
jgi:hypothetical protein